MEEKSLIFVHCRAMPSDHYGLHVTVDGVPSNVCDGNPFHYNCAFFVGLLTRTFLILKMHNFLHCTYLLLFLDCQLSDTYYIHCESSHWHPRYGCSSLLNVQFFAMLRDSTIKPALKSAGSVFTIRGIIYTDVYGSNTKLSSNGRDVRFLRYKLKNKSIFSSW